VVVRWRPGIPPTTYFGEIAELPKGDGVLGVALGQSGTAWASFDQTGPKLGIQYYSGFIESANCAVFRRRIKGAGHAMQFEFIRRALIPLQAWVRPFLGRSFPKRTAAGEQAESDFLRII
jgi:hypothetical protein